MNKRARKSLLLFLSVVALLMCIGAPAHGQQPSPPTDSVMNSAGANSPAPYAVSSAAQATASMAGAQSAAASASASAIPAALLPRDLSPWQMFLSAAVVVKAVMLLLAFASVVTWTVCLSKSLELLQAKRRISAVMADLTQAESLNDAAQRVPVDGGAAAQLVAAAADELKVSATLSIEGIKERTAIRLDRIEARARQAIARGTGILATIGSTAPFVGLFGTVWGIMHSFIGISKAQTTNLAIVAPGIAEALLATALGLVAAIPAGVIYNAFARSITSYRTMLEDASAQVMRLVSRDLDQPRELVSSRAKAAG